MTTATSDHLSQNVISFHEDSSTIRLAFHGTMYPGLTPTNPGGTLKIYRHMVRTASVDRVVDDFTVIGKNLSKKKGVKITTSDIVPFVGKTIELRQKDDAGANVDNDGKNGEATDDKDAHKDSPNQQVEKKLLGTIDSPFGSTGKFKVVFKQRISDFMPSNQPSTPTRQQEGARGGKRPPARRKRQKVNVYFAVPYKINIFDKERRWIQD